MRFFNQWSGALTVRTLTCNKLSHCLFDFDCPDFNVYEQEQYQAQEFSFKDFVHHQHLPRTAPMKDYLMTRDGIMIHITSFEELRKLKRNQSIVCRFMYKPQDGKLWVYNKPKLDKTYFSEIPAPNGAGVVRNVIKETKQKREQDEDEENDVDLQKTLWMIIRKKRSVNQVLKDFFPDY